MSGYTLTMNADILTRLVLCYAEIPGVKMVFKEAPSNPISQDDLPCVYTIPGPMVGQIPTTDAGRASITRQYTARFALAFLGGSIDDPGLGNQALNKAVQYIDPIVSYFLTHPRLNTAVLGDLGIIRDVQFSDSGPLRVELPGGGFAVGLNINLSITAALYGLRLS